MLIKLNNNKSWVIIIILLIFFTTVIALEVKGQSSLRKVRPTTWEESGFGSYSNIHHAYDEYFGDTQTYANIDSPDRSMQLVGEKEEIIFTFNLEQNGTGGTLFITLKLDQYKDCPTCKPSAEIEFWVFENLKWEDIYIWSNIESLKTKSLRIYSRHFGSNDTVKVKIIARSVWNGGFFGQEYIDLYDIYIMEGGSSSSDNTSNSGAGFGADAIANLILIAIFLIAISLLIITYKKQH